MASWEDVRRLAATLPEAVEDPGDEPAWRVRKKLFAWSRPLRRGDRVALESAGTVVEGPVLAASVPDLGAKEALLADDPSVYFTTPHFDGYPAILTRLERIERPELAELLGEAWLCRAPKRLAAQHRRGPG